MKHLEAWNYLIIAQKCLLLEGLISNTCPLITFRFAFMFSNSLKYMFPGEVSMSIFRVWRKHIFGIDIVSVSSCGLVYSSCYLFFLLSLIHIMNLTSCFTHMSKTVPRTLEHHLINSLLFSSLVLFGPKNVLLCLADALRLSTAHCCEKL